MGTPLCPFGIQTSIHSYKSSHLASDEAEIGSTHEHPDRLTCLTPAKKCDDTLGNKTC